MRQLVMANERDSTNAVAVVLGCFPEGDDSILSAFFREPLPAKLQDNYQVSEVCMAIYYS